MRLRLRTGRRPARPSAPLSARRGTIYVLISVIGICAGGLYTDHRSCERSLFWAREFNAQATADRATASRLYRRAITLDQRNSEAYRLDMEGYRTEMLIADASEVHLTCGGLLQGVPHRTR